jgi:hypothetical protein
MLAVSVLRLLSIFAPIVALGISTAATAQRPPPPDLPAIPATPSMSTEAYPDCREDYRRFGSNNDRAAATTRCIQQIDIYHARVLRPYRLQMIAHQEAIIALYESTVRLDFAYTQAQADDFYGRIIAERDASDEDGAHMANYRTMQARYEDDRTYLQRTFCRNVAC